MFATGDKLGNYLLLGNAETGVSLLGSGSGGSTYRARHQHLGTTWALKVLHKPTSQSSRSGQKFLTEAQSAASLIHPHIARVVDFGEERNHLFYVMELCEGGSLEDFRKSGGNVHDRQTIVWLCQAAAALAYSHEKNILHRDIKPSNLLIAHEGDQAVLKVIDFGLAGKIDDSKNQVIGTPYFAAPEQLMGAATPASDVFSLGASLFWILTGEYLESGDVKRVMQARLSATSYAHRLEALAAPWQRILLAMLATDPAERLRDGAAVTQLLQEEFLREGNAPTLSWQEFTLASSSNSLLPAEEIASNFWQTVDATSWESFWTQRSDLMQENGWISFTTSDQNVLLCPAPAEDRKEQLTRYGIVLEYIAPSFGMVDAQGLQSADWMAIAWRKSPEQSALDLLRAQGALPAAELIPAMTAIARGLDQLRIAGFEPADLHPAIFPVLQQAPMTLGIEYRPSWSADRMSPADSGQTLTGLDHTSLCAKFAATLYHLLSGRPVPPSAFANPRAYPSTPHLTERSNRMLSAVIADTAKDMTCTELVGRLGVDERIPGFSQFHSQTGGASMEFPSLSRTHSATWSRGAMGKSHASSPNVTQSDPRPPAPPAPPANVAPASIAAIPASPPPPAAKPPSPPLTLPPAPPKPAKKTSPLIIIAAVAAIVIIPLAIAALWYFNRDPEVVKVTNSKTPTTEGNPIIPPVKNPTSTKSSSSITVPDDVTTIAAALEQCDAGGTITIKGGTYQETIAITKAISIKAINGAALEPKDSESCPLTIKGAGRATISGLTIRNTKAAAAKDIDSAPSLILISNEGFASLDQCLIEGSAGNGIIVMAQGSLNLSACRIYRHADCGIEINSAGKVEMAGGSVMENRVGLSVSGISSSLVLKESTMISRNNMNGIEIHEGASCTASSTEVSYSLERSGVYLTGKGSRLDFQEGKINGNKTSGVFVENNASCTLKNTTVDLNQETGLLAKEAENVTIEKCHFHNVLIGVMIDGAKSFQSTGSTYTKHAECGVLIAKSSLDLTKNQFIDNPVAIIADENATGKIQENTTYPEAPDAMIDVTKDAGDVVLEGNTLGSP